MAHQSRALSHRAPPARCYQPNLPENAHRLARVPTSPSPATTIFGENAELGPGVMGRLVGERVIVGARYGCYAERVTVPRTRALPALEQLSGEENAAFGVDYLGARVRRALGGGGVDLSLG